MRIKKMYIVVILATLWAFYSLVAFAANGKTGVEMSPVSIEIEGKGGDKISKKVTLRNVSTTKQNIVIEIEDFILDENGEAEIITEKDLKEDPEIKKYSIKSWLHTNDPFVSLNPGELKDISFDIQIPASTTPGGHYGILFARPITEQEFREKKQSSLGLESRVGTLILLSIPGDLNKEGAINSFTTGIYNSETKTYKQKHIFFEKGLSEKQKIDFEFEYFNNSLNHQKPRGNIEISNIFGDEIAQIETSPSRTFPGSSRKIYSSFEREYLFGPYVATLGIADPSGRSHSLKTFFFVFPLKFIVFCLILIMCIAGGVYLYGKRIERKYKNLGIKLDK